MSQAETEQTHAPLSGSRRPPLGAGVIGAGFIGGVHAGSAVAAGARLVGVAASTPASSSAAASRLGAARAFADPRELIQQPDVDVVHICTPNHLHAELALAAFEAGKHVIVEKPMALDAAEARRLRDAAHDAGLVATVPFVYRYHPVVREARLRVRRGDAGPIRLLHGAYTQDWLVRPEDSNWRVDAAHGGRSRAFADIGSHWCDLAEFVAGDRIAAVSAELVTAIPRRYGDVHAKAFAGGDGSGGAGRRVTTEDIALVAFRTRSGAVGSVVVSQVSPGRKNHLLLEIAGAEATIVFDQERPESLWIGRREAVTIAVRDPEHLGEEARPYAVLPAGHAQGYRDCMDALVRETYTAIAGGGLADGLPTADDGLRSAAIVDAVLASAEADGRWTEVAPCRSARTTSGIDPNEEAP